MAPAEHAVVGVGVGDAATGSAQPHVVIAAMGWGRLQSVSSGWTS